MSLNVFDKYIYINIFKKGFLKMVLTETGLAKVLQRIKSFIASQLNSKASAIHTHTSSDITDLPNGYVVDSTLDGTSSNAISNSAVSNALDGKSNTGHTHTVSNITDFPTLATVATSGSYSDLSNKPSIPSKTSDLTNDSGFLTSHQDLSSYVPKSGGAVMTANYLGRNVNNDSFELSGGSSWNNGGSFVAYGKDQSNYGGSCLIHASDGTNERHLWIHPNGELYWGGEYFDVSNQLHFEKNDANLRIGLDGSGNNYVRFKWGGEYYSTLNQFVPISSGTHDLGTSSKKWKTINGIAPGSLSLPDLGTYGSTASWVSISSLFDSNGHWTPTADGWVGGKCVSGVKITIKWDYSYNGNDMGFIGAESREAGGPAFIPVRKGFPIYCSTIVNNTSSTRVYFIPCLGNV